MKILCPHCQGSGRRRHLGKGGVGIGYKCPDCTGSGYKDFEPDPKVRQGPQIKRGRRRVNFIRTPLTDEQ